MMFDALSLARFQFAFVVSFHILPSLSRWSWLTPALPIGFSGQGRRQGGVSL